MALWGTRAGSLPRGSRAAARRRRVRIVRTTLGTLLTLALLALTWYGTRLDALTITEVSVSGARTLDPVALTARVEAALDGSYLALVPKRFAYTYPRERVVFALATEARVETVAVLREGRTLFISITEHEPHALWCADLDAEVSTGCVFLSETGVSFAAAPPLAGSVFRRYAAEGRTPEVGVPFATGPYLRATEEFAVALLREHGMPVQAIVETRDGDVRYRIRGGGELIVTRDASVQEVFENLDSILNADSFRHLAPGNFAYIDLRFGSRVFVKELAAEPAEPDAALMKVEEE